ncbi:MAG: DUF2723 domain-containing protein [Kiritimatiellae bacterium]|nr:DUF2723 domain-containing protein [Kiritimatiellia bacterium]
MRPQQIPLSFIPHVSIAKMTSRAGFVPTYIHNPRNSQLTMFRLRKRLFATPWHLIRFFLPFTAIIPGIVFYRTIFANVYPGLSAFLTACAAELCQPEDLTYPLFNMVARVIAMLPHASLPVRLNILCAFCGAMATSLFYLMTARLVFIFACEDPGGSMAALPPNQRDSDNRSPAQSDMGIAINADGSISIPASVQQHNWRVAYAAVLGGLGAASALAFCAPFWLTATRLYPYAFDLMLFLLIINLFVSYDQRGGLWTLFLGVFLLSVCITESSLFLILAPVGGLLLLRALILNGQATMYNILFAIIISLAGVTLSLLILWDAASYCAAIPIPAPRPILNAYTQTVMQEVLSWVPSFGWSYVFVQVLFPSSIALFVFSHSFRQRNLINFGLQLVLVATLIPSLLNLPVSPWGIARMTLKIPIFSYVIIALLTGLMIAVWFLMSEIYDDKPDDELDYYEYRDNPYICRVGAVLCWPLLLLTLITPFRSFNDIDPLEGCFADEVTEVIYRDLGSRDWLVNNRFLRHHLLIRAHKDGRRLNFITTFPADEAENTKALINHIQSSPDFKANRHRLINAADLSTSAFLKEWLRSDTNAHARIAIFDAPETWRDNGFHAVPNGFFLGGTLADMELDNQKLIERHNHLVSQLSPILYPDAPDSIKLFTLIRRTLRQQLSLVYNELAILLNQDGQTDAASDLLKQAEKLSPSNLSVLINRYFLALNQGGSPESLTDIESRLREVPKQVNTFILNAKELQSESGTLINTDIIELIRKNLWQKTNVFRHISLYSNQSNPNPLAVIRDTKRDFYASISKHIDAYELDNAERQLNFLLDLDDKDHFALINKARIAVERRDLPDAGLWLDLAKENGVPRNDIIWHEASILFIKGELEQARNMLNEVIPNRPNDILLWGLLGEILIKLNEYPELENRVFPSMHSASNKKKHYLMHVVRGYILKHNGPKDYHAARSSFLRALALNKNLTYVRELILQIDDVLDVPAFSEEDSKAMLRIDPEHPFANYLLGSVRLRRGQLELAEDLFLRSMMKERNATACAGLGAVMLKKGKLEVAETLLRHSLSLDNSRRFTLHTLAKLLLETGKLDEAEDILSQLERDSPDDLGVRLTVVNLLIKQKKLNKAAMIVSELLDNEDYLPREIVHELKPLAARLSQALSK